MTRQAIGGSAPGPGGAPVPLSKAVRAGDFVYVSGQVPFGPDGKLVGGDIEDQTDQVMRNIEAILKQAGCTMADVIKCTAWLDDPRDFAAFNRTYARWFEGDPPARSAVRAELMIDAKVEVEAIAYKP
ncbi:MAG: RidA family protein [Azospirillaceae bacterium]